MATRLTDKLLRFIYSALNKSPEQFVAFRAQHVSGTFSYTIKNYVLTCYVESEVKLVASLGDHTLLSLASAIGSMDGFSIVYQSDSDLMKLSARVLMDGAGSQVESNGDCFYAYSSMIWVYLESVGKELSEAEVGIGAMIDQMNLKTADDYWLDYWGEHYGIARLSGELDPDYSKRIIVEILRPRGNNKAIEAALLERFHQKATVQDAPKYRNQVNTFNGGYSFNGAPHYYNGTADLYYGLFDVVVAYDLLGGGSPNAFASEVRAFVEKFRDAGTQLQSLNLSGAVITDVYPLAETDSHSLAVTASLDDTFTGPSEAVPVWPVVLARLTETETPATEVPSATLTTSTTYDSQRYFNSLVRFQSGTGLSESWS